VSFPSRRRPIVVPQAEHARFAGALAAAWRDRPPLPFASFVRGVCEHDRGYGELDDDPLGEVGSERWVGIQRRGFAPLGEDAVVDLVVALHVRRLLSSRDDELERAAYEEVDALVPSLLAAAGVGEADALAADAVTDVCDVASLLFCFEEPAEREVRRLRVRVDGLGGVGFDPWPFGEDVLEGEVTAYEREGYPRRLARVAVPYMIAA
jgi:hypothetical protein